MGKTIFQSGYAPGGGITSATTQYWSPACPPTTQTTTEAICQVRIRSPGTFSNLQIRLASNTVSTGNSTFRSRKNNANGGQTVTIPANTSGLFEDTSGSDSVANGDLYCVQMVAGTGAMSITQFMQLFDATTNTVTKLCCNHVTLSGTSLSYYFPPGSDGINQTEAQAKLKIRKAGTFKNLMIYVQVSRATSTTLRSRKNGANGNLAALMTGGTTGWFEDVTNSDTVAVGDDFCLAIVNGTGTDTNTYRNVEVDFETTDGSGLSVNGNAAGVAFTEPTDQYITLEGRLVANTSETNRQTKANASFEFSNITCYVTANGNTGTASAKLRVNGADTALSADITASSTGVFTDSTNSVSVISTDILTVHLNFPSVTGTPTTTLTYVAMWYQEVVGLTRVSKAQIYQYDLTGRVQNAEIYRYSMSSLVSLASIYRYSILSRAALIRIHRYSIQARVSQLRLYKYSISNLVSVAKIYRYSISNLVSLARGYRYSISTLVTNPKIYRYSINARVEQSRVYLYDILSRVTNIEIYRYSISNLVSHVRIYRYSLQARVEKARIYRYSILNKVSLIRLYRYSILSRASLIRLYRYSIQRRVSLVGTYIYNLGESGQLRVSLTQDYLYNIVERVQAPRIYKYDMLHRVGAYFVTLDGVNDYVNCGNDNTLWSQTLTKFSFSIWVYLLSAPVNQRIVDHDLSNNNGFGVFCPSATAITFRIRDTASHEAQAIGLPSFINRWMHVVGTWDSTLGADSVKIYIDGVLGATKAIATSPINMSAGMDIGSHFAAPTLNGYAKDFRWWTTKVLTPSEVLDVRDNNPSAPVPDYWLPMDEGLDNPIDKVSGTKVGVLTNGANWNTITNYANGKITRYLYGILQRVGAYFITFDGVNDYIQLGAEPTLWNSNLDAFTISFWIRPRIIGDANFREIIIRGWAAPYGFDIYFILNQQRLYFELAGATWPTRIVSQSIDFTGKPLDTWYHITVVYDKNDPTFRGRMYLNGVYATVQNTNAAGETLVNASGMYIATPGGNDFAGNMRDLKWYNRALSAAEASNPYNMPTPDYWLPMEEGQGNPIDKISGTKTAILTNGAGWDSIRDYSIIFDGVDDSITIPNIGAINNLDDFSISFWWYPTNFGPSSTPHIVNKGYSANNSFLIYTTVPAGGILFRVVGAAGSNILAQSSVNAVLNQWVHVMVTFVSSTGDMKVFVDGILRGTAVNNTVTANTLGGVNNMTIDGFASLKWAGNIKDFRLWCSDVSASITKIFNNQGDAPAPAYWLKMNEGTGSPTDSMSANTATLVNGATWSYDNPDYAIGKMNKFLYSILGRIEQLRNYIYNINSRVSQLEIYRYSILSRSSLARVYRYSMRALISSQKTFRYSILKQLSLTRVYKYGILVRVESPKTYLYTILQRLSTFKIYNYAIEARVNLLRIYRYSIIKQVSSLKTYLYSIRARVSKEQKYIYRIIPIPSPVKWQLTGKTEDFTDKLENMIKNFITTNWIITAPSLSNNPRVLTDTLPQHQAQVDNFAFDNFRSYYIKIKELASAVETRRIKYNTYKFETPIELECYSRRLKKSEAFNELNNMINELMRIFGTYQEEQMFGIQGITFDRITQMDREGQGARTLWSRRLTIILHYYKISLLG